MPLTITMSNKTYLDLEEITAIDVFERMKETGEIVKTSQPDIHYQLKLLFYSWLFPPIVMLLIYQIYHHISSNRYFS